MTTRREIGELAPFRELLEEWRGWTDSPVADEKAAEVVERMRKQLARAIADAANPPADGVSIFEYAARKRITVAAARKRWLRGKIPGAQKVPGVGIVVPVESLDLAS